VADHRSFSFTPGPATKHARGVPGESCIQVAGTDPPDQLNQLADWLIEQDVESVAMESTYVYWIPIYELFRVAGNPSASGQCATASQHAGTQDRRQRLSVVAVTS
jgi:hypothetical protein